MVSLHSLSLPPYLLMNGHGKERGKAVSSGLLEMVMDAEEEGEGDAPSRQQQQQQEELHTPHQQNESHRQLHSSDKGFPLSAEPLTQHTAHTAADTPCRGLSHVVNRTGIFLTLRALPVSPAESAADVAAAGVGVNKDKDKVAAGGEQGAGIVGLMQQQQQKGEDVRNELPQAAAWRASGVLFWVVVSAGACVLKLCVQVPCLLRCMRS